MSEPADQQLPPVVFGLIIINIAVFGIEQLSLRADLWLDYARLRPLGEGFAPWQLLTYGFLHGGLFHLGVNVFMIWMFGAVIERTLLSRPFLLYYLVCVIGAALFHLLIASWLGTYSQVIGASGGVFGILLAFGLLYPNQMVVLLIPPMPIKAKWLVILVGLLTLWAGFSQRAGGIAHFVHLGGMVTGFALLQYWRGRLPIKPRRKLMR